MCKKQFRTKGVRDTGSKEEEADTVYLLAKKLPHTLVSDQNDEFKKELAAVEAKDIAAFAQAVKSANSAIDGKICTSHKTGSNGPSDTDGQQGRWSCSARSQQNTGPGDDVKLFSKRFGELKGHDKRVDAGSTSTKTDTGWPGVASGDTRTADGMAGDLNKLLRTDKAKVAGLLSKTISGAEVVEIRAVSTTSVMLNACYEL